MLGWSRFRKFLEYSYSLKFQNVLNAMTWGFLKRTTVLLSTLSKGPLLILATTSCKRPLCKWPFFFSFKYCFKISLLSNYYFKFLKLPQTLFRLEIWHILFFPSGFPVSNHLTWSCVTVRKPCEPLLEYHKNSVFNSTAWPRVLTDYSSWLNKKDGCNAICRPLNKWIVAFATCYVQIQALLNVKHYCLLFIYLILACKAIT